MSDAEAKSFRKCLICRATVTAAHFGIDCCRACSAFFKRTKLSGKKFACRAGNRQCVVLKNNKFTCRRCRFDRCVAVGMIYDGPSRLQKNAAAELIETPPSSNISDATSPSTSRGPESILARIGREFDASVERRRVQEEHILEHVEDCKLVPHPTQKIYLANYKTSVIVYNVLVAETKVFFREAFPSLATLSQKERDLLFKSYVAKFSMIESHYRTRKVWGDHNRYIMGSVMICVDIHCTDDWIDEEEGVENRLVEKRHSLIESIRSYSNNQFALILPMLKKAQITNKEFYALLALLLCEIDASSEVEDHVLSTVDAIQKEVLEDLQRYYKEEMGLSDFSTRLGNLMTLNHSIRECNSLFQEFFRTHTTVFDLYRSEESIQELFM